MRSCCEHSGDWPAPGIRAAVRTGYWAPVPKREGGLESCPSLAARSHLGKWRHDEVLSIPIIKDRGRSGVRTVQRQRTWEERGWGGREATLLGGHSVGARPREAGGQGGASLGCGERALTPHNSEHAAGASPEGNGGQGEGLR